ncbi:MAG: ferredoxin family protein [Candidatus Bathyarchaeia archaeon]
MADRYDVWYPTIFPDRCDGCKKLEAPRCIQFCPNEVFEITEGKVAVAHPYKCVYGCTACEPVCPESHKFSKKGNSLHRGQVER